MALAGLDLNLSGFFMKTGSVVGAILLIFVIVAVVGGVAFFLYLRKQNQKQFVATINLFKVVNGKKFWIGADKAKEVVIPHTNVRLLFWKKRKVWSAYPTRSIGFNVYAYMLNRTGELTNFDLGEGADETDAKIDYDHRDQTYAYLNLQEYITRNYKQRDTPSWWKQHIGMIATIIILIVFGLAMWFFFAQSGKQLIMQNQIADKLVQAAEIIGEALTQSSGIGSGVVTQ